MKIWDRSREIPEPFRFIAVLWLTFLLAIIPTGLFFSIVDPATLAPCLTLRIDNEPLIYTLGFFAFWLLCACAGLLTTYFLGGSNKPSE